MLKNATKILLVLLVLACRDLPNDDKLEDPEPPAPTQAGKAFLGWYKSKNFDDISERMDWAKQLTKVSFRLYPKWANAEGYTITSGGVLTKAPDGAIVEIPYNVNQVSVKKIQGSAVDGDNIFGGTFSRLSIVTRIYLPSKGLTEIGSVTFFNCKKLTKVVIPKQVAIIGKQAFSGTNLLASLTLLGGLTTLREKAFYFSGLRSIIIPATVTTWGIAVFGGSSVLTSVTFSDGLTSIGEDAFRQVVALESVTIPASVTRIGTNAFLFASSLKSVRVEALTPPTLVSPTGLTVSHFADTHADLAIKVPPGTEAAYKVATGWSTYADKISEYTE